MIWKLHFANTQSVYAYRDKKSTSLSKKDKEVAKEGSQKIL